MENQELMSVKFDIPTPSLLIAEKEVMHVIESGEVDEIEHFLKIKKLNDVSEKILEHPLYKNLIDRKLAIELQGANSIKKYDALIAIKASSSTWAYISDAEIAEQEEKIKWTKRLLKEQEDALKEIYTIRQNLKNQKSVVDEDTGDCYTIYPAYKQGGGKKSISVTFKK